MRIKCFRIKEKSVFFSWLASYLIILSVPVLISITVYNESEKIIHNEINRANSAILRQVQQSIDSRMTDIERITMDIALNDRIIAVMYPKSIDSFYRYQLVEIISKELKSYNIANDFIDSFYIYLKNSYTVLGPGFYYSLNVAYKDFHQSNGISYSEWHDLLQNKYYKTCMAIPIKEDGKRGDSAIAYFHSFPSEGSRIAATLVVLLNKERIIDIISGIEWIDKGSFFILDKDNQVIISNSKQNLSDILEYDKYRYADDIVYQTDEKNAIIISYIDSEIMDWKYISVIPTSVFLEKVNYIQKFALHSLLLCIVGGGIISYFFTRRNYNPLKKLVSIIKKDVSAANGKNQNEYRFIQETLHNILAEKEKIHKKLEQQNDEMRLNFLRRLLQGKIDDPDTISNIAESYKIHFSFDYFAVVLFNIEEYARLFYGEENGNKEDKLKLVYFIISNVIEEITRQSHQGYTLEINETVVFLININKKSVLEAKSEVMRILEETKNFIENRLYIALTAAVSDIHNTLLGIPQAYQEAVEAMEYRIVMGTREIIKYEDIKNPNHSYRYPMDLEYQLINNIKTGDLDKARKIVDSIFSDNMSYGVLSIDMAKCLMFNLVSTMIKTMNEFSNISDKNLWENINPIDRMLKCNTIIDMKECMDYILKDVCEYIEDKKQSHNIELKNGIIDFIKNHFSDTNMSNTMIADHFSINPAYLSRFFKEQTGEGVLDFINRIRLEEAKRLLKEFEMNIENVAQKTGYNNSVALIRAFKKYEGITPGKFKSINMSK